MSGHSKWSKIKRAKGANDAKKGKVFTRCIHEITVAVREGGGGDPDANARLRIAIDKARGANMPGDNIERAIKRATGEIKGAEQVELSYEGYGPGGAAVYVEALTDNKNRTAGEVRHAFSKCGGSLGTNGCVAWMFKKKGVIVLERSAGSEEQVMELVLEAGGDDVSDDGDCWEITCDPTRFHEVRSALEANVKITDAEIQMIPDTEQALSGKEGEQMLRLMDMLDDLDDVLNVFTNADVAE